MLLAAPGRGSAAPVFSDGFETGDLSAWTKTKNFSAQRELVSSGSWAGRATSPGGTVAQAFKTLSSTQSELYFDARVNLVSMGGSNTVLLRLRAAGGSPLASLNVNSSGKLWVKNHVSGTKRTSGTVMSSGAWHELQLHARIGDASLIEVWFDGTQLNDLTVTTSLGTTPIERVQLGGSSSAFDAAFDDVAADTTFIGGGGAVPATPTNLRTTAVGSTTVDLAWDPSSGATSYRVSRDGTLVGSPTATSFHDAGLSPSTTYSYTVAACNSAGCSAESSPLQVTTAASGSVVVVAAGDIACDPADPNFNGGDGTVDRCRHKHTAALLTGADAVIPIGDTQYECGGLQAYQQSYDPTWGAEKSITYPVVGEDEYDTLGTDCGADGADGFFAYFGQGAARDPGPDGYYSFDLGTWHVVVLNSVCNRVGGCKEGTPQNDWLEQDLAASTAACTLAAFHHPRFASRTTGVFANDRTLPFWEDLYAAGAEIILNGNLHFYERFHPQDPQGNLDAANGIVEFIVGTGGKSLGSMGSISAPNHAAGSNQDFGVLRLTLRDGGYDWEFVPEGPSSFADSGSASCN